ncbi:hypothetical protein G436_1387 [Leptospira interrogans serovar Hardjo str. Norma]|uniref:Uncharacterized protein n=1 Tax=Leptospira interrogans serovar Hardjo str. Norma TaxID=1279460 RepID=A0A0M4N7A2_LEPIR|nr:hypothetical protein G436_1387 [Leptospira interrogans serovar Hardjo str. Norma]
MWGWLWFFMDRKIIITFALELALNLRFITRFKILVFIGMSQVKG